MKSVLLFIVSIFVGLCLMEVGVRVLNMHDPLIWEPNPEFGWKPVPGATRLYTEEGRGWVEINDLGYRDRQRQYKKSDGVMRIGIFGDSQTEAIQVDLEHTYSYLLQDKFAEQGEQVEVLNFGVSGYSPTQELLTIQQEAERYALDLIVLALFLDNDISGSIPELSVSTTGTPFIVSGDSPTIEIDYSRAQESYDAFHQQPKYFIRKISGLYRFLFKLKDSWGQCGEYCETDTIPTRYELYLESPPEQWAQAWSVFERSLQEVKSFADSSGIPLAFLSIPAGQTVNPQAWENTIELNPAMEQQSFELFAPEKRLTEISKTMRVPLLQPYPTFVETAGTATLFFGNVGHLTEAGHKLLTTTIFSQLESILKQ